MLHNFKGTIEEDTFAIIECLLDEHFSSLEVCIPFPAFESFSALVAFISHRCPKLENLKVTFKQNFEKTFHSNQDKESSYTIPPGSSLLSLKSLTLCWYDRPQHQDVEDTSQSLLSIVGKQCPVLAKLKVDGIFLEKLDIVALILNADMAAILFPKTEHYRWTNNSDLQGLRIPSQFLNPLCGTLRELLLDGGYDHYLKNDTKKNHLRIVLRFRPASSFKAGTRDARSAH